MHWFWTLKSVLNEVIFVLELWELLCKNIKKYDYIHI